MKIKEKIKEEKKEDGIKENPQLKQQPVLTLKDKISNIVNKNPEPEELKKDIFKLIQRVLYPDQFCPECDDRFFVEGTTYKCLNCGYEKQFVAPMTNRSLTGNIPIRTPISRPNGKVPDVVEKTIQMAENNMRNPAPGAKGESIRKLAEKLGDSAVPPTQEDSNILQSADPNVRDINWV
jgi:DNA-directed RNA polymerase subunit M/transcription elongation factor TFIIS